MTWAVIGHSIGSGDVGGTGFNSAGANLLIVGVDWLLSQGAAVIVDTYSNTWTQAVANTGSGGRNGGAIWYCANPTTGTGHTAHSSASSANIGVIQFLAVSGSGASPLDKTNSSFHAGGDSSTTRSPGSVTPTQNGELCFAFYVIDDPTGSTFTVDSGFTTLDHIDVSPGAQFGGVGAYFVQTTAAAVNPTWTRSAATVASREDISLVATFKGVAVAETPLRRRVRNLYFR